MNPAKLSASLEASAKIIVQAYKGLGAAEARWKPGQGKWSLLEILCHLCDEERDDFRERLRRTLEDSAQPWPGIDPEGWALERDYNSRDQDAMLAEFQNERAASLKWLAGLGEVDWNATHDHPKIGPLRAGDLLASWAAHDCLHLRQIANTRMLYVTVHGAPYSTRYAVP